MIRKLLCFIGWHSWQWTLQPYESIHLNNYIPNRARCKHCGQRYTNQTNSYTCVFTIELHETLDYGESSSILREETRTTKASSLEEAIELFSAMAPQIEDKYFDINYDDIVIFIKQIELN